MQKGITPVVAVILLLLITISIVGFALVFFSRITQTAGEAGEEQLQQQLAATATQPRIVSASGDKVYVQNAGSANLEKTSLSFFVDNELKTIASGPVSLAPNRVGEYKLSGFAAGTVESIKVTSSGLSDTLRRTVRSSCKEILSSGESMGNGLYKINPAGSAFNVHCDMTADGGGWTLVMKLDGTKTTFVYSSPYWANADTYNPDKPDLDSNEAKLLSFSTVPFTELRIGMKHPTTGETLWVKISKTANSLYDLLKDNTYIATTLGRDTWKSLLSDSSLQPNCNLEGFNVQCGGDTKARIGITSNQENDCGSCDSRIAFGGAGGYCGQDTNNAAGNEATCGPDNGDKHTKAFGYIFVR